MKSEKSGNSRGRPKNINQSVQVSWRIPHEIYQILEAEQEKAKKDSGYKPPLSKVFYRIVEERANKNQNNA